MTFILLLIFAYFLGAVPFGLLFGRLFKDVDVRDFGSGNIGATNVNRVLGRKLGAATLAADLVKGLIPVLLARLLLGNEIEALWVGMAAFLGHVFPIYLKFRGGKGVATAFGVILPVAFWSGIIALASWILVFRISKISAMGALGASITVPISVYFIKDSWEMSLIFAIMMGLVVYRHKDNIKRIRSGAEKAL